LVLPSAKLTATWYWTTAPSAAGGICPVNELASRLIGTVPPLPLSSRIRQDRSMPVTSGAGQSPTGSTIGTLTA
jgi:hypothetical protein